MGTLLESDEAIAGDLTWPAPAPRVSAAEVLEVERWVGAVVLYVTYATDERPAFGLAAYRATADP